MAAIPSLALDLDEATTLRVERLAAEREQPVDGLVRDALLDFVDRQERGAALRRDALAAWADYQATGLHATADEIDAWLRGLEQGDVTPPPECHG